MGDGSDGAVDEDDRGAAGKLEHGGLCLPPFTPRPLGVE
jgi:hypothetical protein